MLKRFTALMMLMVVFIVIGSAQVPGQHLLTAQVPDRVPPEQVPEKVNVVSVQVSKPVGGHAAGMDSPVPQRVPDEEVPAKVNVVEQVKVVTVRGSPTLAGGQPLGTITYRYGFYWFQYNATNVAVAGFAQTTTNFCAQRLFARVKLYRDVEHTGNWEFRKVKQSERTGACVVDSGEARTGFWTAPNGADWMVKTEHLAHWDSNTETWNGQKVDSFP